MSGLDIPTSRCPNCKREELDFDGFGVVAHTWPEYEDGCGWCSHPTRDGDGAGGWVCTICDSKDDEPGVQPGRAKAAPRAEDIDDLFDFEDRADWDVGGEG